MLGPDAEISAYLSHLRISKLSVTFVLLKYDQFQTYMARSNVWQKQTMIEIPQYIFKLFLWLETECINDVMMEIMLSLSEEFCNGDQATSNLV